MQHTGKAIMEVGGEEFMCQVVDGVRQVFDDKTNTWYEAGYFIDNIASDDVKMAAFVRGVEEVRKFIK